MSELSPAEENVITLMRSLNLYEVIEIKRNDDTLVVTVKRTVREEFPYA